MSYLAIETAMLVGALAMAGPARPDVVPACRTFEAKLGIEASRLPKGRRPGFTLTLRNTGSAPLRLLDTRGGRRPDLGDNYYELVIRTRQGTEPEVLTTISDPGPISDADYFSLRSAETVHIPITSPLVLETLRAGSYAAHVVVWIDPLQLRSRCRSSQAEFVVQ